MANAKVTKMKQNITLKDLKPSTYRLFLDIPGHPELKDTVWIDIVGLESKEYAQAATNLYKNRGAKTDADMTFDDSVLESATMTACLIKDWGPSEFFGGVFTKEIAIEILCDFDYKWIRNQIDEASSERAHFFTN